MATRKTLNFLPSIFRSDANKKFLGATLDQLVSEPNLTSINGLVGRKFTTSYKPDNRYITEPTAERQNYQFEPAVVIKDQSNVEKYCNYQDLLDSIRYYGGDVTNNQRLFESEYYSYDPKIDLDKFVNYSQYYWAPTGPDPVVVSSGYNLSPKTFVVTKTAGGYTTNQTGATVNPDITLVRGVAYQFVLNQTGSSFYIQTEPGAGGTRQFNSNVTSRDVQGVVGTNGVSQGTLTFTPPMADDQNYYFEIPAIDYVDYAADEVFSNLDGRNWATGTSPITSINGSSDNPNNTYIVFLSDATNEQNWVDYSGNTVPAALRKGLWKITLDSSSKLRLTHVRDIPIGYRLKIRGGLTNRGYEYFKNSAGNIVRSPAITAPLSTLYYQDSANNNFFGKINIVEPVGSVINVDQDILNKQQYTSPYGVELVNGMKITFDSSVTPSEYQNKTYIVEGVGTAIKLINFELFDAVEFNLPKLTIPFDTTNYDIDGFDGTVDGPPAPDYIVMNRSSQDLNAWVRTNRWFHEHVILKTAEYNNTTADFSKLQRAQRPIIEFKPNLQLYNHGRLLLGIIDRLDAAIVSTAASSSWTKITDAFSQIHNQKINSQTLALMKYSKSQTVVFPNDVDLSVRQRVFTVNYKDQTQSLIFDGTGTGTISYTSNSAIINGVGTAFLTQLQKGSYIYNNSGVFVGIVSKIFNNTRVKLENNATGSASGATYKYNTPVIELLEHKIATEYDFVVVRSGVNAKKNFWFNGQQWLESQQKTDVNQAILFDVINQQDQSLASSAYPDSNFQGNKIISYKLGSTSVDPVLNLNVSYSSVGGSIADINFENNFEKDEFSYTLNNLNYTKKVSTGFLRLNSGRYNYSLANVWDRVNESTKQYQHFTFKFDGITNYFEIDIEPSAATKEKNIKVFVNNLLIDDFVIEQLGVVTAVKINRQLTLDDSVDILIYNKNLVSQTAYYQIPTNLEFNALNQNFEVVTLGQIRRHWEKIIENIVPSNFQNFNTQGVSGTILQHSGSLATSALFLSNSELSFVNSIDYARREYTRFKNKFLELASKLESVDVNNIPGVVDDILIEIARPKNSSSPWFYSDMVPMGVEYVVDTYKIVNVNTRSYNLFNIAQEFGDGLYDFGRPTAKAILVYLNNQQLVYGVDYSFASNSIALTLNSNVVLALGDILTVRGYATTDGCYVPETPTKLGLYPRYIPTKYSDNTYRTPVYVIQGHDGSLTPAFNDYRDNLLLELEIRIYNNIKVSYAKHLLNKDTVLPGKFRTNDYSITEYNKVVTTDFIRWIGSNQIDFSDNNNFQPGDPFSWNYNQTTDSIDGETLLGYWRGIYKYFYDTDRPHTHPWEMLGFTEMPQWWVAEYGTAPYTSSNNKLWQDLEAGYIRNTNTYNLTYARPGLSKVLPVDTAGALVPPQTRLVKNYNGTRFSQSYTIGDCGPVEAAWRRSSEYPFAVQKALALLKPAKYFGLMFDTVNLVRDPNLGQYEFGATNSRARLTDISINGSVDQQNIVRSASYINWIRDYITSIGFNPDLLINSILDNTHVNLAYRLAGFTDKKYITALVDQYSPTSTSETVVVPDENYQLFLNKSVPKQRAVYSAVIVEKTTTGYAVSGYDLANPYFTVIPSELKGKFYAIEVLGTRALVFQEFIDQLVTVPYGFELSNTQEVVDFLISYQRYLNFQGFVFEDYQSDLTQVKDWVLSAKEFLTWSLQGWKPGNVIVLSPVLDKLIVLNENTVVDEITNRFNETQLLNPAFKAIPLNELTLVRDSDTTTVKTTSGQTITFADLNLVQYEHVLVFDNQTVFNDTIFKSELGNRQHRIKLVGNKTGDWTGALDAPGFVYNSGLVDRWAAGKDYLKGDLVSYKNQNYVALQDAIASDTFDFNNWSLTDSLITPGLLPNFAYNSVVSADFYNIDSLTINEKYDMFSNSLIGYRNRSYLENLGLDQTSQSKFYQGYIKTKGTVDAVNTLFSGKFDNANNQLNLYEEWAVRVGDYGAVNSKQNIEIPILQNMIKSNPVAFELVSTKTNNSDNELVKLAANDLYSYPAGYKPEIFLNTIINSNVENNILTAGYVNSDDVDGQIFDITDFAQLNQQILPELSDGYRLWAAKDLGKQWQVYKITANNSVLAIEYSLDNKIKIITLREHGLQIGDIFAIRNFNADFDGFYQVLNTEEPDTIIATFDIALLDLISEPLTGLGEFFVLEPQRYANINDRNSRFAKVQKSVGDTAWVDKTNTSGWQVYSLTSEYVNNFSGDNSKWDFASGQIQLQADGIPYHSYGFAGAVQAETQYFNRIWKSAAGTNASANPTDRGTGIIGFWLNGVAIVSPNLGDFIPGDYESILDFNYNLGYQDYANVTVDLAGGIITDTFAYTYVNNPLSAWKNGVGNISGVAGVAETSAIPYYNNGLAHSDGHSKIVGFANDGYPIYGPFGYSTALDANSGVKRIFSSYQLRNSSYRANTEVSDLVQYPMGIFVQDYEYTGIGDLDQYNGRYCVTPDYPTGTYAYFITTNLNNQLVYPYVIGEQFYGEVSTVINTTIKGTGVAPNTFATTSNINSCWTSIATESEKVDINSVASLYLYNNKTKEFLTYLDYIDPNKGKILGVAQDDIDFISSFDPAKYSNGTNTELYIDSEFHWGSLQVGSIWWDTDTIRYVDYEQYDLTYRLNNWAKIFPGSSVDIYEWVQSDVLPADYVAAGYDGVPKYPDNSAYVSIDILDVKNNQLRTQYFYWVTGRSTVTNKNKKYSTTNLAQLIADPRLQNIPYAAILKNNSFAVYNIDSYVNNGDLMLSVGYKTSLNENELFNEFEFLQEGNPYSRINSRIENKLIDSLVGFDQGNNMVPDLTLPTGSKFGLSIKPNQTLVSNRLAALREILTYVNGVLIKYPMTSRIVDRDIIYSDNLYAEDPRPPAAQYDLVVNNNDEFGYVSTVAAANIVQGKQYVISTVGNTNFANIGAASSTVGTVFTANAAGVGTGTVYPRRVLVLNDAQYNNFWALREKNYDGLPGVLIKLQKFDTKKFWRTVDWYADGFNSKTKVNHRVTQYADVYKLTLVAGDTVKIESSIGKFELYHCDQNLKLILVGLGNGTIQLNSTLWDQLGYDIKGYDTELFDFDNSIELRYIFMAIKQDLFVRDLAKQYNDFIFYIIKYILNEQKYVDWIFKTSFISIIQGIDHLTQEKKYIKDRQLYYQQYINEVRPYRTKLREYVLNYQNRDTTNSLTVTDFDLPAYYDQDLEIFRSPNGQVPIKDAQLLATDPKYQDWNNHYKYQVSGVVVTKPGFGHLTAPDVSIEALDTTGNGAQATATIDSNGAVTAVTVVNTGDLYTRTPVVAVTGTGTTEYSNISNTRLSVRLGNNKVRKIKTTIKFDRITYTTSVVDWQPDVAYSANSYVSYNGKGYVSTSSVPALNYFDLSKFSLVNPADYKNANDRIMSYYNPTASMVPKDLDRLMTGLSNPLVNANVNANLDTFISGGAIVGQSLPVTQLVAGEQYIITSTTGTNFTDLGAIDNRVGIVFTATGPGTGNGTVVLAIGNSAFGNISGISAEDIVLSGGAFIDRIFSHAPEEFLPGITYDTVSIRVVDNTLTGNIGYRRFVDIAGNVSTSQVNQSSITTLAQDFNISDTTITVVNAAGLPVPGVLSLQPGVLHINGERIEYYTKNGNVLGQLRRGAGGTAIAIKHAAGSTVEAVNTQITIPYQ